MRIKAGMKTRSVQFIDVSSTNNIKLDFGLLKSQSYSQWRNLKFINITRPIWLGWAYIRII